MSIKEAWHRTESSLSQRYPQEDAKRDARLIIMHCLSLTTAEFYTYLEYPLPREANHQLEGLTNTRLTGCPMQYIMGVQEFWGYPFQVGPGVLIPRPETEHLVEKAISLCPSGRLLRIADLGCGSGCIAISLALALPARIKVHIEAIDNDKNALQWATKNIQALKADHRVRLIQGEMANTLHGKYDLLLSNPPYIPVGCLPGLAEEIRDFEPPFALLGGEDGLLFYPLLANLALKHLGEEGHLVVEVGDTQAERVVQIFSAAGLSGIEVINDYGGIPRVISAILA